MINKIIYRVMCAYDSLWRRVHRVEKIDELISISLEKYSGERRDLPDGSSILPGDCLAILHFNRECFAKIQNPARSALRFRRLLVASLVSLSARMKTDERLRNVKALYGVTWFPPHGEKVGFIIERLPDSFRNRMRQFYFRLLLKVFFPALAARENNRLQPHAFWLTRQSLYQYFSEESHSDEFRIRKARAASLQTTDTPTKSTPATGYS
jgi:hypothetical protein